MKKMLRTVAFMLAAILTLGVFSGCGDRETGASMPTLNWYLFFNDQTDMDEVVAELNKITEKEIGCHVNIVRIEEGNYNEKIKLALAGNEQVDICSMAPRFNFYSHLSRGAFLALDDVINEYAPETYDIMPKQFWEATKVDGKIYGIPNYQVVGRMNGFVVLKSLLDKYNFDISTVEKLEDIEPFFEAVKNGEDSSMQIYGNTDGGYKWGLVHYVGFEVIGSEAYPPVIRNNDDTLTVVNQYETEEFENFCRLMREWYQKGYLPKQGASGGTADALQQGLIAVMMDNVAPGNKQGLETQRGGREIDYKVIDPAFVNTANIIATMNCIGARTKYPDLCVKFLSLMNRNVDNIYNLMCYGIEGKHYNKVGENRIEKIENSGWDPNKNWEFGNSFNGYLYGTQEDDLWEQAKEVNETAAVSSILGFTFNVDPIKTELSSCEAIITEYLSALAGGAIDPEVKLPEFQSKLKAAGVDKIIEEAQRQIDEWKQTK